MLLKSVVYTLKQKNTHVFCINFLQNVFKIHDLFLGWYGLILISLACINSWYSASILGRSWIILEERWEEYRGKFRYPYPAMGLRSVGTWMRYINYLKQLSFSRILSDKVEICLLFSFFSLSTCDLISIRIPAIPKNQYIII